MPIISHTAQIKLAKEVLTANTKVLYGIFGQIESSGYFPPRLFLNEFFMGGSDPCDQDERMGRWTPFALSVDDYSVIKQWWIEHHPGAIEVTLGQNGWDDWIASILDA
jgi:hypothetical protein